MTNENVKNILCPENGFKELNILESSPIGMIL